MADPTSDIAWDVAAEVLEVLRTLPELRPVTITEGHPGDEIDKEALWLDAIGSAEDLAIPGMTGARVASDEAVNLTFEYQVSDLSDDRGVVYRRVGVVLGAISSGIREDIRLGGRVAGLLWIEPTRSLRRVPPTTEGLIGQGRITLTAHTRLQ